MTISVDDFSFEHPANTKNARWKRLVLLSESESSHSRVASRFYKGWKHPHKPLPKIHAIFKILSSEESLERYRNYRAHVAAAPLVSNVKRPGNEKILFHGTTRSCLLAEDSSRVLLCSLPDCSLCCVIRNSYDVRKCGLRNKFRRFGTGVYTTSCSSKADDYSYNACAASKYRVMLANRVVVGRPHKRRKNATTLTEPPSGYHSVVGKPGVDLNYPETIVYDNDAIRPAFLIVYGVDKSENPTKIRDLLSTIFKTSVAS